MTNSNNTPQPAATAVSFTASTMTVELTDGRSLSVPLKWFATLSTATHQQLTNYKLLGNGQGIHWPQLDEDLSVDGLLEGIH